MNLVADEDIDAPIVAALRADGHDIYYVAEVDPGLSDEAVLETARQQGRLLLTADKGFGELVGAVSVLSANSIRIRKRSE